MSFVKLDWKIIFSKTEACYNKTMKTNKKNKIIPLKKIQSVIGKPPRLEEAAYWLGTRAQKKPKRGSRVRSLKSLRRNQLKTSR